MQRRNFIKNSAMAGMTISMPFSGNILGSNDRINLAVIGLGSTSFIGGKGKRDLRAFAKIPGVNVMAICDCDEKGLMEEKQKCADDGIQVKAYKDFRDVLDNKDVDAIQITTPNHSHALITVMACQAEKHVYCQKPASHNIFEGRKMVEAARKYNRIVQVPHGARTPNGMKEAFAYARSGALGKIKYVHGINYKPRISIGKVNGPVPVPEWIDYNLWSGPAPMEPLMRENLHYDWHWDWTTGNGDLGNMGIHYIDGCRMAIGADYLPRHVMSFGGRLGYDDDGETPNTQVVYLDYEEAPVIFEVRGLPTNALFRDMDWRRNRAISMDTYRGIQVAGLVVHCEDGYISNNQAYDTRGRLLETFESTHEDDKVNFINAMKKNDPDYLYTDVEVGHLSAALVHMGNASYRIGKKSNPGEIQERVKGIQCLNDSFERFRNHLFANRIDWEKENVMLGPMLTFDAEAEQFTGEFSEEANQHITREYREPFVVPEKV
jgi:predicted dehydrogenase